MFFFYENENYFRVLIEEEIGFDLFFKVIILDIIWRMNWKEISIDVESLVN